MSKASKNQRDCPAVGHVINPRECGEGRHSQFRCPADCPYNPFSPDNYDEFGEIEQRVIRKTMDHFVQENRDDFALIENYRLAMEEGIGAGTAFSLWHFFWRRDENGKTMADRWEARRFEGLTNDERTVLAGHRQCRPALVESRNITDDTLLECVDLFRGEKVTVADHSLCGTAVRFDAMFGWFMPQPHFSRFLGAATLVPSLGALEPMEVLRETARHLGAPEEPEALERWLAEHWRRVSDALAEISKAMRHGLFRDSDLKYHTTEYEAAGGTRMLHEKLAKQRDVRVETLTDDDVAAGFVDELVWLEAEAKSDDAQPELPALVAPEKALPGRAVLGRVLLGANKVRIEASSTAKQAQLRPKFERLAGDLVKFASEKVVDLAAQIAGPPDYDAALVPSLFFEHAPKFVMPGSRLVETEGKTMDEMNLALAQQHHAQWPDTPIPAFGGRTPREAAAQPELRGKLIGMVKDLVRRADRESFAASEQATQLITALGLTEIAEPTPPDRPEAYTAAHEPEDQELDSFIEDDPPRRPLREAEVDTRLADFIAAFPPGRLRQLTETLDAEAGDLLEVLDFALGKQISQAAWSNLMLVVARLYFVIVPVGTERTELDPERFEARANAWRADFIDQFEHAAAPEDMLMPFDRCRQPVVGADAVSILINMMSERGGHIEIAVLPLVFGVLAATIDELDVTVIEAR